MQIKINFMKKHLYVLTALIVVLAGTMLVIGYEKGQPSKYGHTADEISASGRHGAFGGDEASGSDIWSFEKGKVSIFR